MAKVKEEVIEEVMEMPEDLEIQTVFNEDSIEILCTEDTIVENVNAEEVE